MPFCTNMSPQIEMKKSIKTYYCDQKFCLLIIFRVISVFMLGKNLVSLTPV